MPIRQFWEKRLTIAQFEKIFVINLPSRTDRRDAIVLSAALSDIELEVVNGVYGDTVKDKAIPAGPGKMTASEKGCWRSHMNIIQESVLFFLD